MLTPPKYHISAKVWLYQSMKGGGWHFISLDPKLSEEIKQNFNYLKGGWGSIRIEITIGATTWQTSMFPDTKSSSYIIPIKSAVRKTEKIAEGDQISASIQVLV